MRKFNHSLVESNTLKLLLKIVNPVIVEVGCNDGAETAKLLDIFPNAKLFCFEPDPRAIEQFIARELPTGRVTLYRCAIGARDEIATFHQSSGTTEGASKEDWDLSGSLNKPTGHLEYSPWCKFENTIEVPVRRLDDVLGEQPIIDLLWMDVQGGEANVLDGAQELLPRVRYIYSEFGHWRKPLYDGQMTLQETIDKLGPAWAPLATYEGYNILLANQNLL